MWAKVEIMHSGERIIELPSTWSQKGGTETEVIFGGRSTRTGISYRNDLESIDDSFKKPGIIMISTQLRDELLLPESLTYQLTITDTSITLGPVIGLLLGSATHRYNPIHMEKYSDRFGVYPRIGGLIYAFSPKFINWRKRSVYGLYYCDETASWEYGCFPLPQVIYRRDFHTDPRTIERLLKYTGGELFNSHRFTKYELYDLIKDNHDLRDFLPPTEYSREFDQIKAFIDRHKKVILKPVHLSRGRGICIIEKLDDKYQVIDFRCQYPVRYELYDDGLLENFFDVYQDFFNMYLIQKYIPLAEIDGAPFDIRVVMHKQTNRSWGATGIECRISNNGYLTNISRGGYALPLEDALQQSFPGEEEALSRRIHELCRSFCEYMDTLGEHFAELGLDIAVDIEKRLWLIEANVFPSFKGFKKMDYDIYLAIRHSPMLYAASRTLGQSFH